MAEGADEIIAALGTVRAGSIAKMNETLDESADILIKNLRPLVPVDKADVKGDIKKTKPRSRHGIRQITVGFAGSAGVGATGWRAHFVDTGTIKHTGSYMSEHARTASEQEILQHIVKRMKVD